MVLILISSNTANNCIFLIWMDTGIRSRVLYGHSFSTEHVDTGQRFHLMSGRLRPLRGRCQNATADQKGTDVDHSHSHRSNLDHIHWQVNHKLLMITSAEMSKSCWANHLSVRTFLNETIPYHYNNSEIKYIDWKINKVLLYTKSL